MRRNIAKTQKEEYRNHSINNEELKVEVAAKTEDSKRKLTQEGRTSAINKNQQLKGN